jgi:hypothetical protein
MHMENNMARMPLGQPRSVPDPHGELYDLAMAQLRAQRDAEDRDIGSPVDVVRNALHQFQSGPRIPRPNTLEAFIPVVGPAWEAVGDLQDGDYGGAAINGAAAIADAFPVGVAVKGVRAAAKGVGVLKKGAVTADAARKVLRRVGMAGPGQEIHHAIPLKGIGRNVEDVRNHYAFLKVLPQEQHRRLTGSWLGKPRYDPIRRTWYGTTDWMKALPVGAASYAAELGDRVSKGVGHAQSDQLSEAPR